MEACIVVHGSFIGISYCFHSYIERIMISILEIKTCIRLSGTFFGNNIDYPTYTTTSIESWRSPFDYLYTLNSPHRHHIVSTHVRVTLSNRNLPIDNYQRIAITSRVYSSKPYPWSETSSILIYIIDPRHKAYSISYGRNCQFLYLCSRNNIYSTCKVLDLSLNPCRGNRYFRKLFLRDFHLHIE